MVLASSQMAVRAVESIGTPILWTVTIVGVVALIALDFAITHRPHSVSFREAIAWSGFYIALPVLFGVFIWVRFGAGQSLEYYTGYLVEKSLSVDNLFVFMLLLSSFAVPPMLAQRVLLYGIAGALILRGILIAVGAAALSALSWAFLLFGAILLVTAVKLLRDAIEGADENIDIDSLRSVKLLRRLMPVTAEYQGPRMLIRQAGRWTLTPLALVVTAVFTTDVLFAIDSIPAVYGITQDPFLVFATNAFSLLGLRALYFVLHTALAKLIYLSFGLSLILAIIGVKLLLHWGHEMWSWVPQIPTGASLVIVVVILSVVTVVSLWVTRVRERNGVIAE
jgi:tellurite resistance protein TerC